MIKKRSSLAPPSKPIEKYIAQKWRLSLKFCSSYWTEGVFQLLHLRSEYTVDICLESWFPSWLMLQCLKKIRANKLEKGSLVQSLVEVWHTEASNKGEILKAPLENIAVSKCLLVHHQVVRESRNSEVASKLPHLNNNNLQACKALICKGKLVQSLSTSP